MSDHTPISKVSRLDVISTGARRRWTLAEKQRIVAESYSGQRLVSVTARRHGLSASQLFTWRRLARAGRLVEMDDTTVFAPAIIISGESSASDAPSLPKQVVPANIPSSPCPAAVPGRIEIVLLCGSRVIVDDGVDATALRRVLDVLERSS
ncbi:transposase [Bradyrhizobium sp. GM24.11]